MKRKNDNTDNTFYNKSNKKTNQPNKKKISNKLDSALEYIIKKHPDEITFAIPALQKIDDTVFTDKSKMNKYGRLLKDLCDNYTPASYYDEIFSSDQAGQKKKIPLDEIAAAMMLERSTLENDIHNYRFNPDSKRKDYFNQRRARLLLYSLFFEVSPLYLVGLTDAKHDYDGPVDPMVMGNETFYICYDLLYDCLKKLEIARGEEEAKKHTELLDPLKWLGKYIDEHPKDNEAIDKCCSSIATLLNDIPTVSRYCHTPPDISQKQIKEAKDSRLSLKPSTPVTKKYFNFEFHTTCITIGERSFVILYAFTMLVYFQKWELLNAIYSILKMGEYGI